MTYSLNPTSNLISVGSGLGAVPGTFTFSGSIAPGNTTVQGNLTIAGSLHVTGSLHIAGMQNLYFPTIQGGPAICGHARDKLDEAERERCTVMAAMDSTNPTVRATIDSVVVAAHLGDGEAIARRLAWSEDALRSHMPFNISDIVLMLYRAASGCNIDVVMALDNFIEVATRNGLHKPED